MTDYGRATCIDCGTESKRLLHAGFPHICSLCLFPPAKPDDPTADPPEDMRLNLAMSLAERIEAMRGNGIWRGGVESFGKPLPETRHRGNWE